MKKKYLVVIGLAVVAVCFFIPYRTVLVPKWRLQVVNENGVPYPNKLVRQFCTNYTLDADPCSLAADDTYRFTDENGYVEFSEKSFSMSLLPRILTTCKSYLFILAHGSVGSDVYVDSSGPDGYKVLNYAPGSGLPPDHFILPSKGSE